MYYPKLTYASSTIEGVFLFGILFLLNKIYGLESLYYIGNFQIMHMEETNKSQWETPLMLIFTFDRQRFPSARGSISPERLYFFALTWLYRSSTMECRNVGLHVL